MLICEALLHVDVRLPARSLTRAQQGGLGRAGTGGAALQPCLLGGDLGFSSCLSQAEMPSLAPCLCDGVGRLLFYCPHVLFENSGLFFYVNIENL